MLNGKIVEQVDEVVELLQVDHLAIVGHDLLKDLLAHLVFEHTVHFVAGHVLIRLNGDQVVVLELFQIEECILKGI